MKGPSSGASSSKKPRALGFSSCLIGEPLRPTRTWWQVIDMAINDPIAALPQVRAGRTERGSSGPRLRLWNQDHPVDAELVDYAAEALGKEGRAHRHLDLAVLGKRIEDPVDIRLIRNRQ
jgi:hypothetical protein